MKTRRARIKLWVGPLCCSFGMMRSMSGSSDSVTIRGMSRFCRVALEQTFPTMYPSARCARPFARLKPAIPITLFSDRARTASTVLSTNQLQPLK